ncbi:MAG TPA: quinone-dependent dihydroorotate dehydrogenase [Puia sp.]|nr:quinone-dependent dihydroorotate dehydrogenase [Puia sp.]
MYKLLRTILFFFPAEAVHHFSMKMLRLLCSWGVLRRLVSWSCRPEGKLERQLLGLNFRNGVGLGAGFDKNALYLRELEALGFGFVEIGTVTPRPQPGNEQPRLFRLPQDQGLINRMGFNNDGVEVIAARLRAWREGDGRPRQRVAGSPAAGKNVSGPAGKGVSGPASSWPMIVGGNLGKNKTTPNEDAWKDYEICFRALYPWVDYFVVNVSSPNTPGLRELQDKDALRQILTNLQRVNAELSAAQGIAARPLLLKIAPDLNQQQLDDVIALALEIRLDGLVATNTTIGREGLVTSVERVAEIGAGGLSGAPLRERATEVVKYLAERSGGQLTIIASGGIFTASNASEKIAAGASMVQVWTGFIYEGPFIVARICSGLAQGD